MSESVWMDYSNNQPDAVDGLDNLRDWIKGDDVITHDHAALILG